MKSKDQAKGGGIGMCFEGTGPIGLPDGRACTRGRGMLTHEENEDGV